MDLERIITSGMDIARQCAYDQLDKLSVTNAVGLTPIQALSQLRLTEDMQNTTDEIAFANLNITLDPRGCFGRMAISAAYIERYFPKVELQAGDVIDDYFLQLLDFDRIKSIRTKPGYLEEILMYEDPHTVLVLNGHQYEPLSNELGYQITHPKIELYPVWNFAYSSMLCAVVALSDNIEMKNIALEKARQNAAGIETKYMQVHVAALEDDYDTVIKGCKEILAKKQSARALLTLYRLTGDNGYKEKLLSQYTEAIFEHIKL